MKLNSCTRCKNVVHRNLDRSYQCFYCGHEYPEKEPEKEESKKKTLRLEDDDFIDSIRNIYLTDAEKEAFGIVEESKL